MSSVLVAVRAPEVNTRIHTTAAIMLRPMIKAPCFACGLPRRISTTIPRMNPITGIVTAVMYPSTTSRRALSLQPPALAPLLDTYSAINRLLSGVGGVLALISILEIVEMLSRGEPWHPGERHATAAVRR